MKTKSEQEKTEGTEKPMLFTGDMVRAILRSDKGRVIGDKPKTQTRRLADVMKDESFHGGFKAVSKKIDMGVATFNERRGKMLPGDPTPCPYGMPGARIWVRETFWQTVFYPSDDSEQRNYGDKFLFAADGNPENTPNRHYPKGLANGKFSAPDPFCMWVQRPSIFMPRKLSRINLEIGEIRVERLQDISESDAIAEGILPFRINGHREAWWNYSVRDDQQCDFAFASPVESYRTLWEFINGKGSWKKNPWVWVIGFKRQD